MLYYNRKHKPMKTGGASFIPTSVPNLSLWYDVLSSVISTTTGLVDSITDLSGNANTATGVTTNRPTYTANDGDGFPCIDSNNKYVTAGSGFTSLTEETIFMVVKVAAVSSTVEGLFGGTTGNFGAFHTNATTPPQLNWTTNSSTTNGTGGIRDVWDANTGSKYKILRFRRIVGTGRAGYMEIYENGLLMDKETHSSGTESYTMRIGARGTSASIIKWRAFLHYSRALSDSECERVERYLNLRYNVYSVPAWATNELPQVKRYAIANDITASGDMSGGDAYLWTLFGDSTAGGFALKSGFDSEYIKAFTDAFIYEWNTASDWQALDTTDTASHTNKPGNGQATAGMEATLSWEFNNAGYDSYVCKFHANGSTLADDATDNNWNVSRSTSNYPTRLRRFIQDSINEEVCRNGRRLILAGNVIYLGTNDATEAYYSGIQTNLTALIDFVRGIQGLENSKIAICEIFSASASYPRITEARAALIATAAANSNCYHIDGMDSVGDTVDNTHPNSATYTAMASTIKTNFIG